MIPIGAFARLTGLSAKALRHYHDRGVLVPAHVDPDTGYRGYDLGQFEDAIRVAVLRQAEMPLERIARVLEFPDRAGELIDAYRAELRADRARVDRALDHAGAALSDGGPATERVTPPGTFVAVRVAAPSLALGDSDDAVDRRVAEAAERCRVAIEAAGLRTDGPYWTSLDADAEPAVVVHWPLTSTTLPDTLPAGVTGGRLPARTERVVRIPAPERPGDASVQLALAALLGDGRVDPSTVRQTLDGDVVEFAVTRADRR